MVIKEINNLDLLSQEELEKVHTEVHVLFKKVSSGDVKDWTFRRLYDYHRSISNALIRAGGKHFPIDNLDNIEIYEQCEVLDDYSHLENKRILSTINYSGNEEGEEIYLKDILSEFRRFKLKEPFIYIVGGLCNHGKTKGDIDILIKKSRPKNVSIDVPLKFRIMRQLPKKYWHRLHFLYDDEMHGPFTNYVPLYSLVCEINTKEVFEMSEDFQELASLSISEQAKKSRAENKIIPFRFFTQPKPIHGRAREEIYSLDSIEKTMNESKVWSDNVNLGIFLEKKFDGVRVQIHKVGDKVKILSEEGKDYTSNLPTIVDELKKIKHDFIVEGEAELWLKSKHQNRADSAGLLNKKTASPDEKDMFISIYDCVWFDGEDLHKEPFIERRKSLEKISSKHIKVSEAKISKGMLSIKRLSKRFASLPGSEGVMYKLPSFIYELDGKSYNFMKFKKERSIIAKVIAVHKVAKTEKTFYYHCAIEGDTFIGKTFNTNIALKAGEKLEVVFVDLNQYTDPETKKVWFNWWSPRVIQKSSKSPTSIESAKKLVQETSGQISERKVPKISSKDAEELEEVLIQDPDDYDPSKLDDKVLLGDHRIVHTWASSLAKGKVLKFASGKLITRNIIQDIHRKIAQEILNRKIKHDSPIRFGSLSELSYKKKFVLQSHYRGKSHHFDLRFERDGFLEGYTLMAQVEGEIKEPVINLTDAKREDSDDENFKINLKTGELKQDKIEIATKAKQPKVWLDIAPGISLSGMEAGIGRKPEPGATAKFPGVFTKIDSGTYEEGARKPFYLEYFLDGKVFKGRYIVRKLARARIEKVPVARTPFVWFFWKPDDQTPYVLSSRGISKSYVPEKGRSALPEEWEKKIPKELQWWKKGLTGEKALEMIKKIRKEIVLIKKLESNTIGLSSTKFALKRKWWKGQFVIRGLPVEHFELRLDDKKNTFFKLDKNPLAAENGITSLRTKGRKSEIMFEGTIAPGEEGNPNKKIPAHIDILDSGSCNITEDSENFMHIEFKGKDLKTKWIFKRTDPQSNIWLMSKGKLPKDNLSHQFGAPLSDEDIHRLHFLSENNIGNSEISHLLDRPIQTVYDWQKKLKV